MRKNKDRIDWGTFGLVVVIIFLVMMIYIVSQNDHFFGASVASPYVNHFNNKMRCAYVSGWSNEQKCMCILVEDDPRIKDKTLLASHKKMCKPAHGRPHD